MHQISREYVISAAHRLEGHPKCGRLHGHNYNIIVTLCADKVPNNGMLMDYGDMDKLFKPIIDNLDHKYLISDDNTSHKDPYAPIAVARGDGLVLPIDVSTAENLAEYLCDTLSHALRISNHNAVSVFQVEVRETPKSSAVYVNYRY